MLHFYSESAEMEEIQFFNLHLICGRQTRLQCFGSKRPLKRSAEKYCQASTLLGLH